jgi:hypothetical protein
MPPEITTIIIVAMVGGFALVSKLMREIFRRRDLGDGGRRGDSRFDEISQKLETLQQSIDATAIEVERLGEGLRFTTKILAERNGAWDAPRQPDRVITPH